jgi:hypothetical protein
MRGLHVLLALGLAAALASPAPAATSRDYASCVARVRPSAVRQLLNVQDAGVALDDYRMLTGNDYCFSRTYGGGAFRPDNALPSLSVLRGDLAELSLLRDPQAAALRPLPLQHSYDRGWFAATGRVPAVDEMAACMADTDPAAILGLVRTDPGSWDERAWMTSLPASLTRCLTAGVRLDADRAALRAALADALYQRVHRQQDPESAH